MNYSPVFFKVLLFVFIGSALAGAANSDLSGKVRVVDGDTLIIGTERVRLHGIDAPEQRQSCLLDEKEWPCGLAATEALKSMIADGLVECIGQKRDRYGRLIAICYLGAVNLNAEMVRKGWALPYLRYSQDYRAVALEAEANRRGIWKSQFIVPWLWRQGNRLTDRGPRTVEGNKIDSSGSTPSSGNSICCKVCKKGKPCGNSCVARSKVCRKGPGCAC